MCENCKSRTISVGKLYTGTEERIMSFTGTTGRLRKLLKEMMDNKEIDSFLVYSIDTWKKFHKKNV